MQKYPKLKQKYPKLKYPKLKCPKPIALIVNPKANPKAKPRANPKPIVKLIAINPNPRLSLRRPNPMQILIH
jgi:hypothetical protein